MCVSLSLASSDSFTPGLAGLAPGGDGMAASLPSPRLWQRVNAHFHRAWVDPEGAVGPAPP